MFCLASPFFCPVFGCSRWPVSSIVAADPGYKIPGREGSSEQPPMELLKIWETDKTNEKEIFQRYEWFGRLMRFRNDFIIIFSIICLQLPIELAYAHLFEVIGSDVMRYESDIPFVHLLSR